MLAVQEIAPILPIDNRPARRASSADGNLRDGLVLTVKNHQEFPYHSACLHNAYASGLGKLPPSPAGQRRVFL